MSILDYTIEQLDVFNSVKFWLKSSNDKLAEGDFINCAISLQRAQKFISEIEQFI